ncbi:MAG: helix-turn-helix domain-containing protein [Opitutales bacterium]
MRPSEVATKTGFYDASDFSRQFRRAMKLSPTEYRRLHGSTR